MNTCDDHGADVVVVFQGKAWQCPICKLVEEKTELETKVEDLESSVESLKEDLADTCADLTSALQNQKD